MRGSSLSFGVRSAHFTSSHASSPCAHVVCLILYDFSTFFSLLSIFSPISTSSSTKWWSNSLCTSADEDVGTLAEYDPLTGCEPNDYHISETTEPYIQESSVKNGHRMTSSTMTTPSVWRSLYHCSTRSEKMMRAVDEPITLKTKVCRPVSRRPSVMIERRDPL